MTTPLDVSLYLLVDLAIIILAARLAGALARRLGQPGVIGEIIAGIVLGPTLLGRIDSAWPAAIFPSGVPLNAIGDLGLVLFMFLVGVELDTRVLRANRGRPLAISLSGIVLPGALGLLAGYLMYEVNAGGSFLTAENQSTRLTLALFVAVAMCITAFPVLARILRDTGLDKTPIGQVTLTAAAVDDVAAWLLLAGIIGLVRQGDAIGAIPSLVEAGAFFAILYLAGRPLLAYFARLYEKAAAPEYIALVLAGLLFSAFATQRIGVHLVFGAFLFGAIMPRDSRLSADATRIISDFTLLVLLPAFFLVTGLRTNLLTLDSLALAAWLVLVLAVAMAGKLLGCLVAARITGFGLTESAIVGSLMNTRGLTELIILSVGYNLGVLSDRLFAMMVVMALVTTVMATPIVNYLLKRASLQRYPGLTRLERGGLGAVDAG